MYKKTILFISALTPPISGTTTASHTVLLHLRKKGYPVYVIDYARGNLVSGKFSLKQFFNIILQGFRMVLVKRKTKYTYLTISSTFWGSMRDVFFLFLLGKKKRQNTILHIHTSTFNIYISRSPYWVKHIVKKMFTDVKAVIVLGETFINMFDDCVSPENVKIVKNCAQKEIFISQDYLVKKYSNIMKINILYLGNLIPEKGYELILDAYISLPKEVRRKTILNYAGEFPDCKRKNYFLDRIKAEDNIFYCGPVQGREKIKLLWDSHIFCLPTSYYYEAQPISVLEAYAAGCLVLTTEKGGIRDIFKHGVNGYLVSVKDKAELRNYLELLVSEIGKYKSIAFHNYQEAIEKYTEDRFNREIEGILLS